MTKAGNSQILQTIPLLITIFSLNLPTYAQYSGGTGEPNDPYQIATAEDLMLLGETPEDYDKHFILIADIDLDPNLPGRKVFERAVIAPDADPEKWDFQGTSFTGILDGRGHAISHLTIAGEGHLGLFGRLAFGAEVRDLGIVDANVAGSRNCIGALVGINGGRYEEKEGGTVVQCYSTGSVSGSDYVGCLVGENWGEVIQSYGSCDIIGDYSVGGLLGSNYGNVRRCYATGLVLGTYSVGGVVGKNWAYVTQSYGTGDVSGTADVGGLAGGNSDYAYVTYCRSSGMVKGNSEIGGLVGENYGVLTQCYSTGGASGWSSIGGLVGELHGNVNQCYSAGSVSGIEDVGGLVGKDVGYTAHCFWDTQTSGQISSDEGTGKTTAEMQDIQTYLNAQWDFVVEIANGTSQIWQMPEEGGYPILAIFNGYTPPLLQGLGTREDPYVISDALDLGAMVYYDLGAHYQMVAPIDLSGIHWGTPVIPWLQGTFDGGNETISDLTITGGAGLGLFGQVASEAEVRGLGVVDSNVTGLNIYIGGLVGELWGKVQQCSCKGAVLGDWWIGGLVGYNHYGEISGCHSDGTVNGGWYIGGLVGRNWGDVNESYCTCEVSGTYTVGGLLGDNDGSVTYCYCTGPVISDVGGLLTGSYIGGLVGSNSGPIAHCYFSGTVSGGSPVGGLVGVHTDSESITYCHSDGIVSGQEEVGGLVGLQGSGILSNCHSTCTVNGGDIVGGLVGLTKKWFDEEWPKMTDCYSTGAVNGVAFVGGLVGTHGYGIVSQCHSNGTVSGAGDRVGGLIGSNTDIVEKCYSTGSVSGSDKVGGLVGSNAFASVRDCYSRSHISGEEEVGGLVGYNAYASLVRCYSSGTATGTERVGGLVGYSYYRGNINACFWDMEASGLFSVCGAKEEDAEGCDDSCGKTTAEMRSPGTFVDAGWDFVDEIENGTEDIWWILEGQDYPRLWWETE